jgi:uncharacterized SAM-binding protein YcdF (DUF218 family)
VTLTRRQWFDRYVTPRFAAVLTRLARIPACAMPVRHLGASLGRADPVAPADLLVVLGGGSLLRAEWAATLFARGVAPRVQVFSSARPEGLRAAGVETTVAYLVRQGVPVERIAHAPAADTLDEARLVGALLARGDAGSALVVTDAYHLRRARAAFAAVLGARADAVRLAAHPSSVDRLRRWWTDHAEATNVAGELIGLFDPRLLAQRTPCCPGARR